MEVFCIILLTEAQKPLRVKYIQIKFFAHFASLREVFLYNFAHRGAKGAKGEMDVAGVSRSFWIARVPI